ncbi:hypothetical protein BGW36DRAFT_362953 [Talaromyces proteolyticus]|uniref:Uncharacterized protein n=1 Tax=Talaromyces proteolyticus TaxID=1131652 RepID=A0AAD4KLE5_9EURO|nr:uncharacterized protein BGW36DRAFT_362953 [Talaromyces proteolyticus]KAH8691926.1 hypothetical protein BGW36DRAFT_362953 [Talaromyces proteolyticus]
MDTHKEDDYVNWASQFLTSLSSDNIIRHRAALDPIIEHIGPLLGWTRPTPGTSRMITAKELLDLMQSSLRIIQSFLAWDMVDFIVAHTLKPGGNSLASLRPMPDVFGLLLHTLYILGHTTACYGPDVDHSARASNREEFFKGKIPAYCKTNKLDRSTMERCIGRGSKASLLGVQVQEPGIVVVAAPVISSFSLVSYREIDKAAGLLLSGRYPHVMELARQFSKKKEKYQKAFHVALNLLSN